MLRAVTLVLLGLVVATTAAPAHAGGQQFLDDPLSAEAREWVDDNGPVRIGWFVGAPPVSVWKDGELAGGYATQAWDLAAVKVGVQVEHVVYPGIPEVVEALRTGEIDIAGAHGERPDLAEFATMAEPTAWERITFVARTDRVGEVGQFEAGTASTISGSPLEAALREGFPQLTLVPTESIPGGLAAVEDGELDLYLGPLATLGSLIRAEDLDVSPVGEAVSVVPIGSWAVIDTPAAEVNAAARASLTPAELATLHVRWTGFDLGDPEATSAPTWLLPSLLGLLALLALAGGVVVLLRRRVAAATAELQAVNDNLEHVVEQRTADLSVTAARLRRSNEALQRFTSTAAHDLKGPLTAISGLADVAHRLELDHDDHDEMLARISRSAHRLGRMVDDMLRDAIDMGAPAVTLTGGDFADWLREVTAPELDVVGGELTVDVDAERRVDTNVEVLRRTTINLVSNAIKYATNEAGTRVRVGLHPVASAWELVVEDNGPGIPRAMWSDVFDHGTRLTHDDRGFGLGLAAVRDLVQGVGGSISVGDAPVSGARFEVRLPVVEEARPAPADVQAGRVSTD